MVEVRFESSKESAVLQDFVEAIQRDHICGALKSEIGKVVVPCNCNDPFVTVCVDSRTRGSYYPSGIEACCVFYADAASDALIDTFTDGTAHMA